MKLAGHLVHAAQLPVLAVNLLPLSSLSSFGKNKERNNNKYNFNLRNTTITHVELSMLLQ